MRTSSEEASRSASGVVRRPRARHSRSRRTMFSISMIASSTTTPTATAKPARTIVLMFAPSASRTIAAAASDSGIASRLTSAARHSNRNASRTNTTRTQPITTAKPRLPIAVLMKVDWRKMCESMRIPGSPGAREASARSIPFVTSSVLAPGNFSTTSIRPGPALTTASPIRGGWSYTTRATSPIVSVRAPRRASGMAASCCGVVTAWTLRMSRRWFGVSTKPPVPTAVPVVNDSSPASTASEVAVSSWSSEMRAATVCGTSAWTSTSLRCSPHMATLATPGTCSSRLRIV